MKRLNKIIVATLIIIMLIITLAENFNKVYAEYGLSKWNTGSDSQGRKYASYYYGKNGVGGYDWRTSWDIDDGYGESDYGMHVNFACFVFDNIYCIQKGYAYEHDGFNIKYKIEIEGNDATLYHYGGSSKTWTCTENNVMAGIINAGDDGYSVGIRVNGPFKGSDAGTPSDLQNAISAYWGTFEKAMNDNLKTSYDWRI